MLMPCLDAPVLPAAADTVKRERPGRQSFVWRRSKIPCIRETGPSAERHRLLTHLNRERSRNRMLIYNQCYSGWSQVKSHSGLRLQGARLPPRDCLQSLRLSG